MYQLIYVSVKKYIYINIISKHQRKKIEIIVSFHSIFFLFTYVPKQELTSIKTNKLVIQNVDNLYTKIKKL